MSYSRLSDESNHHSTIPINGATPQNNHINHSTAHPILIQSNLAQDSFLNDIYIYHSHQNHQKFNNIHDDNIIVGQSQLPSPFSKYMAFRDIYHHTPGHILQNLDYFIPGNNLSSSSYFNNATHPPTEQSQDQFLSTTTNLHQTSCKSSINSTTTSPAHFLRTEALSSNSKSDASTQMSWPMTIIEFIFLPLTVISSFLFYKAWLIFHNTENDETRSFMFAWMLATGIILGAMALLLFLLRLALICPFYLCVDQDFLLYLPYGLQIQRLYHRSCFSFWFKTNPISIDALATQFQILSEDTIPHYQYTITCHHHSQPSNCCSNNNKPPQIFHLNFPLVTHYKDLSPSPESISHSLLKYGKYLTPTQLSIQCRSNPEQILALQKFEQTLVKQYQQCDNFSQIQLSRQLLLLQPKSFDLQNIHDKDYLPLQQDTQDTSDMDIDQDNQNEYFQIAETYHVTDLNIADLKPNDLRSTLNFSGLSDLSTRLQLTPSPISNSSFAYPHNRFPQLNLEKYNILYQEPPFRVDLTSENNQSTYSLHPRTSKHKLYQNVLFIPPSPSSLFFESKYRRFPTAICSWISYIFVILCCSNPLNAGIQALLPSMYVMVRTMNYLTHHYPFRFKICKYVTFDFTLYENMCMASNTFVSSPTTTTTTSSTTTTTTFSSTSTFGSETHPESFPIPSTSSSIHDVLRNDVPHQSNQDFKTNEPNNDINNETNNETNNKTSTTGKNEATLLTMLSLSPIESTELCTRLLMNLPQDTPSHQVISDPGCADGQISNKSINMARCPLTIQSVLPPPTSTASTSRISSIPQLPSPFQTNFNENQPEKSSRDDILKKNVFFFQDVIDPILDTRSNIESVAITYNDFIQPITHDTWNFCLIDDEHNNLLSDHQNNHQNKQFQEHPSIQKSIQNPYDDNFVSESNFESFVSPQKELYYQNYQPQLGLFTQSEIDTHVKFQMTASSLFINYVARTTGVLTQGYAAFRNIRTVIQIYALTSTILTVIRITKRPEDIVFSIWETIRPFLFPIFFYAFTTLPMNGCCPGVYKHFCARTKASIIGNPHHYLTLTSDRGLSKNNFTPNHEIIERINIMSKCEPKLTIHIECYHYAPSRRTTNTIPYVGLDNLFGKKITHLEDIPIPILQSMPITPTPGAQHFIDATLNQQPHRFIGIQYNSAYQVHPIQQLVLDKWCLILKQYYRRFDKYCTVNLQFTLSTTPVNGTQIYRHYGIWDDLLLRKKAILMKASLMKPQPISALSFVTSLPSSSSSSPSSSSSSSLPQIAPPNGPINSSQTQLTTPKQCPSSVYSSLLHYIPGDPIRYISPDIQLIRPTRFTRTFIQFALDKVFQLDDASAFLLSPSQNKKLKQFDSKITYAAKSPFSYASTSTSNQNKTTISPTSTSLSTSTSAPTDASTDVDILISTPYSHHLSDGLPLDPPDSPSKSHIFGSNFQYGGNTYRDRDRDHDHDLDADNFDDYNPDEGVDYRDIYSPTLPSPFPTYLKSSASSARFNTMPLSDQVTVKSTSYETEYQQLLSSPAPSPSHDAPISNPFGIVHDYPLWDTFNTDHWVLNTSRYRRGIKNCCGIDFVSKALAVLLIQINILYLFSSWVYLSVVPYFIWLHQHSIVNYVDIRYIRVAKPAHPILDFWYQKQVLKQSTRIPPTTLAVSQRR